MSTDFHTLERGYLHDDYLMPLADEVIPKESPGGPSSHQSQSSHQGPSSQQGKTGEKRSRTPPQRLGFEPSPKPKPKPQESKKTKESTESTGSKKKK
jgi:hypothetical protein